MTDSNSNPAFAVQADVRGPWRRYLDALAPMRPALHRFCCRLTGNVGRRGPDAGRAAARGFGLLGKIDADLEPARVSSAPPPIHGSTNSVRATRHRVASQCRRRGRRVRVRRRRATRRTASGRERVADAAAPRERGGADARSARSVGKDSAVLHPDDRRRREQHCIADANGCATTSTTTPAGRCHRRRSSMIPRHSQPGHGDDAGDLFERPRGRTRRRRVSRRLRSEQNVLRSRTWCSAEYAKLGRKMVMGTDPHWRAADYRGSVSCSAFARSTASTASTKCIVSKRSTAKSRIRCYCFARHARRGRAGPRPRHVAQAISQP